MYPGVMAIKPCRTVTVGDKPFIDRDELQERLAAQGYHATLMRMRTSDPVTEATWQGYLEGINMALRISGISGIGNV